ncbi:ribosomal protection-like ABC-F family protein [Clostridium amazonitimonense]|uniref:ribosomal protection-like ABC-F family protein n=1 Tax=Clostridium amazonitimonense TaxID=1499689 RepID=UPI00068ABA96|nr:ABC-F type ribosomal protection protein [Clostridium amazonitimonense]
MKNYYIYENEVTFMAVLLSLQGINKEFGEVTILDDVNFHITLGHRVGLVGLNGAGKSTLANIIYGKFKPDKGSILWHKKDIEIGYLKQDSFYTQRTWTGEDLDVGGEEYIKDFLQASAYLGMKRVDVLEEESFSNLSGGEKMKVALANIWSLNPDFLILDEPTNHVDYEGVEWLIKELKKYRGTILIISHDRYFLDNAVNEIIEINKGKAYSYSGNYSFYREEKRKKYESQLHQYEIQESSKAKIQEEINRLKNWSSKAHRDSTKKQKAGLGKKEYFRLKAKKRDKQIKSKVKKLEKMVFEGVKRPEEDKKVDFKFNEANLKGTRVIEARNIKKSFESNLLFKESSFYIMRGDRVGIFGPNGCGKTTLLKVILGKEDLDEGEIFTSKSITIGYLSQETLDIDTEQSVIDIFNIDSREEEGTVRTLLANMGFNEKMITQPMSTLSHGELTRIRMARLIRKNQDLLVLDEPLNHLDLYSREKLEEALRAYDGTIILVSHDRYMLENLCDFLLVFKEKKISKIVGTPKEYLDGLFTKEKNSNHTKIHNEKDNKRQLKEEKMLIENEIAYVLGELSKFSKGTLEYDKMDIRFKELIDKKRKLDQ